MSSLKADFDELRERIRHGRELGHASFEPIYYLVFPPEQILEVKRQTPAWVAKLHQEGWDVHTFSIAEHDLDIAQGRPVLVALRDGGQVRSAQLAAYQQGTGRHSDRRRTPLLKRLAVALQLLGGRAERAAAR